LTGVLNNVQLIKMIVSKKQEFKLEDFLEFLNVIEESAQRCSRITKSLLSFSRASKEISDDISINDIIGKVLVLIEHELGLQNISIIKDLGSGIPFISGEPQLIQQVVFDLIGNAKWAIQNKNLKDGGTITLKTAYDPGNNLVCFSVSDTGIGIPKEHLEKIFEPFFTTKPVGEGTGLGLSIVYNIVKEHNGIIEVDSELGKWTVFKVCLPAAKN
jgi:two-component system NtrC family sensor kinase